ncbi:MAG: AAA family ATPase, partial [Solirubrobacteraceae bacterium]
MREIRAGTRTESIGVDREPLLERSEQLGVLKSELDAVAGSGRGRLVLIAGEAGIGKSAVVDAFCRELDISVLRGACEALFTPRPLGPLVDIGDQLGGKFAAVVDAGVTPSDLVAALAGELRRGAATVVVLEDLHWADDGFLDFVDELVDWLSGVALLVVCSARPELLERRPGWGGGKLNASTLGLSPLSREQTAVLISHVLERALLPAEIQQALLERAEGNPLYAEQFAALYLERGSAEDMPLPETLQGILAARLDGLSAGAKALLQDASVIGKV